ncbi:MAG: OmpA family protein [Candidatus Kaiserbacteria bacterium]|nr:OmpA family protein [Candidatus Kaiserbacteria bacterium]
MSTRNQNLWVPFADIMTALMLIFLLIVVVMFSLQDDRQESVVLHVAHIEKFDSITDDLLKDLNNAFSGKRDEWGIRVSEDLTVKFEKPEIIFDQDQSEIKDGFKSILDSFVPTYLSIISKEKYQDSIKEVRIEGHTADVSQVHDTYMKTVHLSQNRAREILRYILESQHFNNLGEEEKNRYTFLLSANGFGYGRTIDDDGNFVYSTGRPVSSNSRRVEFRVVTNSDEVVKKIIGQR